MMWKIHYIALCIICTVCGFLFLPLYLVISVLFMVFAGIVFFYDLPLSVHVASLRLWIESVYFSAVNTFHQNKQNLLSQRTLNHSNGMLNNHVGIYPDKPRTSPNLISRNKLSNDKKFRMPLHSTPIGLSKGEFSKGSRTANENEVPSSLWSDRKTDSTYSSRPSAERNVQTVAGPLLVSTRFNSGINAELLADVRSDGFSSRVAQRGSARDGVTHQEKYSGIGVFPVVQLSNRSPKHSLSPRNSTAVSRTVRVRIAPPDHSPFGFENTVLSGSGDGDSMKSVLQVLKEMSRKRIHSQVDEEEDDKVKRQKKEICGENTPKTGLDGGLQNKRVRDDSPRSSEEVKRQRRQTNMAGSNEIMSSLSSSLAVKPPHLMKGTKRKAHTVDWSRSNTPVSGKLLKVNISPVNRIQLQNSQSFQEEDEVTKSIKENITEALVSSKQSNDVAEQNKSINIGSVTKTISDTDQSKGNDCVRIEAGQRRVLARAGDLKEVPVQEVRMYDSENDVKSHVNETLPSISVQRIKDPGRRLKDMLAAIDGSDDIDADSSDMSPSVIAILKTAKTPSRLNKVDPRAKSETTPLKSPVSILKTPGGHDSHKSVTFSDQVLVEKNKLEEPVISTTLSPQTCLSTATVVSNSINTSISSASETVPYDYGDFGSTSKNSNSSQSSPNIIFATSAPSASVIPSAVTSVPATTSVQQSLIQSSFSSPFTSDCKSPSNPNLFVNAVSPTINEKSSVQVSGPSNKVDLAVAANTISSGGFSFGNIKSPASPQASVLKTPAAGIFGMNKVNPKTEPSPAAFNSFSSPATSISVSAASVSASTPLKPGSFSFNAGSKLDSNLSAVEEKSESKKSETVSLENVQKPQFGNITFGNLQSPPSFSSNTLIKPSTPSFGGFVTPNITTPVSTTVNCGTLNSIPKNPQVTAPSSTLSTTGAHNTNSIFSFGSNSPSSTQAVPKFGSIVPQPSAQSNVLGSISNTTPQITPNNSFTASSHSTLFGGILSNNLTSVAASNTSQANSTSIFGNNQINSSTATTPAFGSGSIFGGTSNKPIGFGTSNVFSSVPNTTSVSAAPTSKPSLFNNFSSSPSQRSNVFGNVPSTVSSSFSPASVTTTTPVFGQPVTSSVFSFGPSTVTTQNSLFGGNANPVNSSGSIINGPSTFSNFSSNNNNNSNALVESDKSKPSPFGGGGSFQTPTFNFGSNPPPSNTFSFSTSSNNTPTTATPSVFKSPFNKPPEQKSFGFDAPQTSMLNSTPVFAFGQSTSAQPSPSPAFNFNASTTSQQPSSTGLYNFGAGTNATNSPFGSGINPPTFSIGAGGTPGVSGMFSIGSGSSTRSSRVSGGRSRRTK